jgi:hypothetical protein
MDCFSFSLAPDSSTDRQLQQLHAYVRRNEAFICQPLERSYTIREHEIAENRDKVAATDLLKPMALILCNVSAIHVTHVLYVIGRMGILKIPS